MRDKEDMTVRERGKNISHRLRQCQGERKKVVVEKEIKGLRKR